MKLHLPCAPKEVYYSASGSPEDALVLKSTFSNDILTVNINEHSGVLWIDPTVSLTTPLPAASLEVNDAGGRYAVPLRGIWSQGGDWVYYAQADAREPGDYVFNGACENILIQDIWDPSKSGRGTHAVKSVFHDGTEFYFTVKPGSMPHFTAHLQQTFKGRIDTILRNGDFQQGIPNYPPRMWVVRGGRNGELNWGGWSQENPHNGTSSLRFFRDHGPCSVTVQPMRLRKGGEYHLRFFAKGNAGNAAVYISGAQSKKRAVPIKASDDWQEYNAQIDLPTGGTALGPTFFCADFRD